MRDQISIKTAKVPPWILASVVLAKNVDDLTMQRCNDFPPFLFPMSQIFLDVRTLPCFRISLKRESTLVDLDTVVAVLELHQSRRLAATTPMLPHLLLAFIIYFILFTLYTNSSGIKVTIFRLMI